MSDIRYEVTITSDGSAIISRIEDGYRYVCDEIIPIEHRDAVARALMLAPAQLAGVSAKETLERAAEYMARNWGREWSTLAESRRVQWRKNAKCIFEATGLGETT